MWRHHKLEQSDAVWPLPGIANKHLGKRKNAEINITHVLFWNHKHEKRTSAPKYAEDNCKQPCEGYKEVTEWWTDGADEIRERFWVSRD